MNYSPAPASGAVPSLSSLGWGAEFGALFTLGWPLIVAQLAQISLLTTDVIMMGWLGPKYLAAGTLANALFICALLFGIGLVGAVAPMVAQALGAGDLRSIRRTVRQGIWVAIITGLALLPILWNIRPIYLFLGQDPELSAMAEYFVHYAVWLLFPSFLLIVFRSFLSAHGATRVILLITVAGVFVNAVCDYALMFGNWGFPRLELAGAGIATTTVNIVMLALMVAYIVTHRRFRRYHIFHHFFVADWPRFWEIWRIGMPIGLMLLAEVSMFTCASLLQGWIGQDSLAAHAIALQLSSITFMVPLGLSQATTVRIGLALGERNPEGIRKAGWTSLAVTLAFMASAGILFFLFPDELVRLFLSPNDPANAHALALATSYLLVAALFQLVDGTQVTMAAALRGLSDTNMPLVIALIGYWAIGFPVAYILGFPLGLQGVGVWFGLAAGLAATAIILVIRFAMRDRLGLTSRVPV
jgi:MATE family multidrug resistance protein